MAVRTNQELLDEIALRIFDNDFGGVTAALVRIVLRDMVDSAILRGDIPNLNELLVGLEIDDQGRLVATENDGSQIVLTLPEAGDPGTVTGTVEDMTFDGTNLSLILDRRNNIVRDLTPLLDAALRVVATDDSLTGDGTAGNPLEVATPANPVSRIRTAWHYSASQPATPDSQGVTPSAPPSGWTYNQTHAFTSNEWELPLLFLQDGTVIIGDVKLNRDHETVPPPSHEGNLYLWTQTGTGTPSAIPSGAASGRIADGQQLTIPNGTQDAYIVFAQPAATPDITRVIEDGSDQIGAYAKQSATFVDTGVTYEWWRSNRLQRHASYSGAVLTFHR